jgi:hypothetical protein
MRHDVLQRVCDVWGFGRVMVRAREKARSFNGLAFGRDAYDVMTRFSGKVFYILGRFAVWTWHGVSSSGEGRGEYLQDTPEPVTHDLTLCDSVFAFSSISLKNRERGEENISKNGNDVFDDVFGKACHG